jgi:hypothetical protein
MTKIKHELISKENARIIREQQCEDLNLELRFFFKNFHACRDTSLVHMCHIYHS